MAASNLQQYLNNIQPVAISKFVKGQTYPTIELRIYDSNPASKNLFTFITELKAALNRGESFPSLKMQQEYASGSTVQYQNVTIDYSGYDDDEENPCLIFTYNNPFHNGTYFNFYQGWYNSNFDLTQQMCDLSWSGHTGTINFKNGGTESVFHLTNSQLFSYTISGANFSYRGPNSTVRNFYHDSILPYTFTYYDYFEELNIELLYYDSLGQSQIVDSKQYTRSGSSNTIRYGYNNSSNFNFSLIPSIEYILQLTFKRNDTKDIYIQELTFSVNSPALNFSFTTNTRSYNAISFTLSSTNFYQTDYEISIRNNKNTEEIFYEGNDPLNNDFIAYNLPANTSITFTLYTKTKEETSWNVRNSITVSTLAWPSDIIYSETFQREYNIAIRNLSFPIAPLNSNLVGEAVLYALNTSTNEKFPIEGVYEVTNQGFTSVNHLRGGTTYYYSLKLYTDENRTKYDTVAGTFTLESNEFTYFIDYNSPARPVIIFDHIGPEDIKSFNYEIECKPESWFRSDVGITKTDTQNNEIEFVLIGTNGPTTLNYNFTYKIYDNYYGFKNYIVNENTFQIDALEYLYPLSIDVTNLTLHSCDILVHDSGFNTTTYFVDTVLRNTYYTPSVILHTYGGTPLNTTLPTTWSGRSGSTGLYNGFETILYTFHQGEKQR